MESSTSTGMPAGARSRDTDRTAASFGTEGGKSAPTARMIAGGRERRTRCQLRRNIAAIRNTRDVVASPLARDVRMSRHLGHGDLREDIRDDGRRPHAPDPRIRLEQESM